MSLTDIISEGRLMRVLVTGASGWIGGAVVPLLLESGHQVVGLARSDASAAALDATGAEVHRGDLDDLDGLRAAAGAADGVIHLAFKHDLAFSGDFGGAVEADRQAIEAVGSALAGSDRPFLIASGTLGLTQGTTATEADGQATGSGPGADGPSGEETNPRHVNAQRVVALASEGVRSVVVRLPPTIHGQGDNGFMATIVGIARQKGMSGYVGDGSNRWPAAHRLDAAEVFRLGLEQASAGSTLHAVAEQGIPLRAVAEVIGRHLDLPVVSIDPSDAADHFGWLGGFIGTDSPASSTVTRDLLGWQPTHPGLLDDLEAGHYFDPTGA